MAVSSGLYIPTFVNALNNDVAIDMGGTLKVGVVNDTYTPNFDTHDYWGDITNEVTGTNWPAGGVSLTTPTVVTASGFLVFDAGNVSVSTVTMSNAEAAIIYDDAVTTPTADALICCVDFGAPYSPSGGTFAITWSTSPDCIFRIDMVP